MSFGFSVGDFIAVVQLANQIRQRFVDAPDQFKAISNDVRNLAIVLQDVEVVVPQRELTSEQKIELAGIAQGCRNVLKEIEVTLDGYQELDSSRNSFGGKSRRVWKRLKWDQKDIDGFRSRTTLSITLLNTFLGRMSSQAAFVTKDGVDRMNRYQNNQEHRVIVDWLTPIDYCSQQSDFIRTRQEGTGQWLLESSEFQAWVCQDKQTLFCPGIPGAGKTVLTSIVVDHMERRFENDHSIGIVYLYCNFRRQHEQSPEDLLASLLKQLIQGQPSMPESMKSLYERHKSRRSRPSFDEISKELHSVASNYSRTFIIIDALDECEVSDGGRRMLLSEIFNLQAKTGACFFATSRFIPEIMKEFEGRRLLEIRAGDNDVRRYIDAKMSRLRPFVERNFTLQEEIKSEVIKAVDGMFLLARLYLDSLVDKTTIKAIRLALKGFRKESEASNDDKKSKVLDHAYTQAMERIEGQEAGFQELAKQVLSWITCAKRPLNTLELQHAIAVEIDEPELDKDNLPEIDDMVSVCAGLVTVDEKSNIIRLVHYTTQEYFERTQKRWFPDAETDITKTCVTYLSFDAFATGFCVTDKEFKARLHENVLYDYAARNWGYHARVAFTATEQLILSFLESEAKLSASSQAMIAWRSYFPQVPRHMTGVHVAAYFGLGEAIIALLNDGHNPDPRDTYGQTPLMWAADSGHDAVVRLLLAKDGVEADSKDIFGHTPLFAAADRGHDAVVRLLLAKDDVDPNAKNRLGHTPLVIAADRGHDAVVRLLLAKDGVEVDSKDNLGTTPLWNAAFSGRDTVVQLLLDRESVDPNSKHNDGSTPLWNAASRGHDTVVKLLLEKSADLESKDNDGRTPLLKAASKGHDTVVKLLLEKGAELESKDNGGRTPLLKAASDGHDTVVKLLLEKGAELESKDNDTGRTPLSWAAGNGHEAVVKLLLDTEKVNAGSKDNNGWTPLSWAAEYRHETVVKLLEPHILAY